MRAVPRASKPAPDVARYRDGTLKSRGFSLEGEMHGKWEFFRKDGSMMRAGKFDRGRQVGVWRTFDRTGRARKGDRLLEAPLTGSDQGSNTRDSTIASSSAASAAGESSLRMATTTMAEPSTSRT